jgi:hypothetical protein
MTNNVLDYLKYVKKNNLVKLDFSNDMYCIKYIMYFIHPYMNTNYKSYSPSHIFDSFYDLPHKQKIIVCETIKKEVNDNNLDRLFEYLLLYIQ